MGRRRLTSAIPALEGLCRRFKGFGLEHAVPEQIAALNARPRSARRRRQRPSHVSSPMASFRAPDCAMPSMPPSSSDAACLPRSPPPFYDITTRRFGLPPVVQSDLIPKSCHCWSICWMTSMDPLRLPQVAHWAALEGLRRGQCLLACSAMSRPRR